MATRSKASAVRIGKLSRRKGKVFEQFVSRELRAIFGGGIKRGWQAREGADAPDVDGSPYWVECKHHQRVNIQAAVLQAAQAVADAHDSRPVVVVSKDNRTEPLVTMLLPAWLDLVRATQAPRPVLPVPAAEAEPVVFLRSTSEALPTSFQLAQPPES